MPNFIYIHISFVFKPFRHFLLSDAPFVHQTCCVFFHLFLEQYWYITKKVWHSVQFYHNQTLFSTFIAFEFLQRSAVLLDLNISYFVMIFNYIIKFVFPIPCESSVLILQLLLNFRNRWQGTLKISWIYF